jgi:hypothetical protein
MGVATAGLPLLPVRRTGRTTSIFERQMANTTGSTSEGQQKAGKNMRRIATLVITALIGFAVVCVLAGCSNDETVIRNGLTEEFNQFKNAGSTGQSGDLSTASMTAWRDGYAFEVGEITVEGNSATAELTLTYKPLYVASEKTQDRMATETFTATGGDEYEQEYMKRFDEILVDELNKLSPVTTRLSIACEKTGNTWVVSDASWTAYQNTLLGQQPAS